MSLAFAILMYATSCATFAGVANEWILQGTVEQFNDREVLVKVEDGKLIVVPRSALGDLPLKPGGSIRYSMPVEALKSVRAPHVRKSAAPARPAASAPSNEFVPSR